MFGFFKAKAHTEQHTDIAGLSSFSAEKRKNSAKELARLCREPSFHPEIIKSDGISRLAHLVSTDNCNDVREYALIALRNLVAYGDAETKSALVKAGAISQIVYAFQDNSYWLSSKYQQSFKFRQYIAALITLNKLAFKHPANQTAIVQAGVIERAVRLLKCKLDKNESFTKIQSLAALLLCNLAFDHIENQKKIIEAGGGTALLDLLRRLRNNSDKRYKPKHKICEHAVSALSALMKNPANNDLILVYGAYDVLKEYSLDATDSVTQHIATELLKYESLRFNIQYRIPGRYTSSAKIDTPPSETTIHSSTHMSSLSSIEYSVSEYKPSPFEEYVAKWDEREEEKARQKERDDYRKNQVEKMEFWKYQREIAGGVEPSAREEYYEKKINKHDGSSDECRIS